MKINKTSNDNNAAEPKTFAAGTKFLQIEPTQVSNLDLISVGGGGIPATSGAGTVVELPH